MVLCILFGRLKSGQESALRRRAHSSDELAVAIIRGGCGSLSSQMPLSVFLLGRRRFREEGGIYSTVQPFQGRHSR